MHSLFQSYAKQNLLGFGKALWTTFTFKLSFLQSAYAEEFFVRANVFVIINTNTISLLCIYFYVYFTAISNITYI